jgi:hypothetical protein
MKKVIILLGLLLVGCNTDEDLQIAGNIEREKGYEEGYEKGYKEALLLIASGVDVKSELKFVEIKNIGSTTWSDLPNDFKVDIIKIIMDKKDRIVTSNEIDLIINKVDKYYDKNIEAMILHESVFEVIEKLKL